MRERRDKGRKKRSFKFHFGPRKRDPEGDYACRVKKTGIRLETKGNKGLAQGDTQGLVGVKKKWRRGIATGKWKSETVRILSVIF